MFRTPRACAFQPCMGDGKINKTRAAKMRVPLVNFFLFENKKTAKEMPQLDKPGCQLSTLTLARKGG